jgi:DNA polymerase-3 subunit epsilon
MRPLAFVDIETTGSGPQFDAITEIGLVLVDQDGVREWSSLLNPGMPIPASIESLTGISNEMVADAPRFAGLAPQIFDLLSGRIFLAHNARFDYGFIKQAFQREGYEFRATTLCTVKLSRMLYPGHRHHNLDALIERHALQVGQRHRALGDARLIHQFWQLASQGSRADAFEAAVKLLTARPSLPSHLGEDLVDRMPEGPGVYVFRGKDRLVLYVGKSRNIRQRVLAHFSGDVSSSKEMSLAQQVRDIEWHQTGGEVGALLKEAALIKELQPTHNRRLRRASLLCSIALAPSTTGLRACIVELASAEDAVAGHCYGLFNTTREAQGALRKLAVEHGLCQVLLGLEKPAGARGCFARQLGRCRGACVGAEHEMQHAIRLMQALDALKLKAWPYPGAAYLREGGDLHLVKDWAWLGTAQSEEELHALLEQRRGRFDRDSYRILARNQRLLRPLPASMG